MNVNNPLRNQTLVYALIAFFQDYTQINSKSMIIIIIFYIETMIRKGRGFQEFMDRLWIG
jgi:hypothetical protein